MARGISEKTWEKWLKEDLELHKRVITTYLYQEGINVSGRNKFFKLYSYYIDIKNIRDYLHIPVHIFVRALIQGELEEVKSYVQSKATEEEHERFARISQAQQKEKAKQKRKEARAERRRERKKRR